MSPTAEQTATSIGQKLGKLIEEEMNNGVSAGIIAGCLIGAGTKIIYLGTDSRIVTEVKVREIMQRTLDAK